MRKIYATGETVFDIIFKNGQPQAAKAGGSMLNSAVSLGRIGLPVFFISEYGVDDVGRLIGRFLNENGVNTGNVHHFTDGSTKLAVAFLDEKNDATYTFYEKYPHDRLTIDFPVIQREDIILYGSIYAITDQIRKKFRDFINSAGSNGATVIYDPNFRSSHLPELERLKPMIIENMQMASLVRGSHEDFRNIFGSSTPDEAWEMVRRYCGCLVYTASGEGVFVRTSSFSGKFPVKKIETVSTIGAGDNFNAGMIASLWKNNITRDLLTKMGRDKWLKVVSMGVDFATDVCMSYENYISLEFAGKFLKKA
ncbi:MAG: carbohydrate kinase [Bacteroidales bacterium]|nr:carbohydrate kinase [Bacteroidales bacterium]